MKQLISNKRYLILVGKARIVVISNMAPKTVPKKCFIVME